MLSGEAVWGSVFGVRCVQERIDSMVFMEGGCAQVMLICEFLEVYMSIHLHSIVDDKRIPDIICP